MGEKRLFLRKDAKRGKIMGKEAAVSIKVVYIIQTKTFLEIFIMSMFI